MNRRADPESITYTVIPQTRLADYLDTASALHGWAIRIIGEGETQCPHPLQTAREMGLELPGSGVGGLVCTGYRDFLAVRRHLQCYFQHRRGACHRNAAGFHPKSVCRLVTMCSAPQESSHWPFLLCPILSRPWRPFLRSPESALRANGSYLTFKVWLWLSHVSKKGVCNEIDHTEKTGRIND